MSRIKVEFEKGGVFVARLLEDEAPLTCKAILAHLPFAYRFHHSMVSGQAMVTLPPDLTVPRENQWVVGVKPGALTFLVRDVPVLVPDEIYIVYGLFMSRGLTVNAYQPVNVFAQIDVDVDGLAAIGRRVLMGGAEIIRFSRLADGNGQAAIRSRRSKSGSRRR